MCLSTVYSNSFSDSNIIAKNIMLIECEENKVILTDLMERKTEIEGTLLKANLTDGYVIVKMEA